MGSIIFFILLLLYFLVCVILITLILMQEGKGGGLTGMMGASVGETFGYGGATGQIRKFTAIAAGVFLVFTIVITFASEGLLVGKAEQFIGQTAPAVQPTPSVTATPAAPAAEESAPAAQTPAAEAVEATPAAEATPAQDNAETSTTN